MNAHIAEYLDEVNQALKTGNKNVLTKTEPLSKRIRAEIKQLRRKHLEDLSATTVPPPVMVAYLATLNAYARVRDPAYNIAEAISGE